VKRTSDRKYKWSYSHRNSKGEAKFKHDVGETLCDVLEYLDSLEGVEYNLREGGAMLWIIYDNRTYAYYYTTGRWAPKAAKGLPRKHYHALDIKDFMERFVFPKQKEDRLHS
jgi:hypothetical protein